MSPLTLRYLKWSKSYKQKVEWYLQELWGKGENESCFSKDTEFEFFKMKNLQKSVAQQCTYT